MKESAQKSPQLSRIDVRARPRTAAEALAGEYASIQSQGKRTRFLKELSETDRAAVLQIEEERQRQRMAVIREFVESKAKKTTRSKTETELLRTRVLSETAELTGEAYSYLQKHPNTLHELSSYRFEQLVADILKHKGYEVQLTPRTRDQGRDVLAILPTPIGDMLTIVECKRWSPDRKIDIDVVRSLMFTVDRYDNASCGLIATTSFFGAGVRAMARDLQYRLKLADLHRIQEWVGDIGAWERMEGGGLWVPK